MNKRERIDRIEEAMALSQRRQADEPPAGPAWQARVMEQVRAQDMLPAPGGAAPERLVWRVAWSAAALAGVVLAVGLSAYVQPDSRLAWLCLEDSLGVSWLVAGL